jgi:hypothetical protein
MTSPRRTVAIMQPTYLPWIGYLDLMDQCDLFVLFDCVQFEKRSWQQRNRIKTAAGEAWLTVPVLTAGRRDQAIHQVEIDPDGDFAERHLRTIRHAYGRAPNFRTYFDELAAILRTRHRLLVDLNAGLLAWLGDKLGVKTEIVRSSTLPGRGQKVERLVSLCAAVGATRYLSPPGAREYVHRDDRFSGAGIDLCYHHYEHPTYRQLHGDFVSHLSVLDLLFMEGDASLQVLRSGRRAPLAAADADRLHASA